MLVIYDLQDSLLNAAEGKFVKEGPVRARYIPPTNARIEQVEDIKTICVHDRNAKEAGIDILLSEIPNLQAGDRITVTGRVGAKDVGNKHWSIALIASYPEDGQITQHTAPDSVFSVSHILEKEQTKLALYVHTVLWGSFQPLMDFYIDGVLVTRQEESVNETDTRTTIYELSATPGTELTGSEEAASLGRKAPHVYCAGYPTVRVFNRESKPALHVGNRFNDWDGIDINIGKMNLRPGNQYKIIVHGRIDGDAPVGATIMLQGVPGYVWKNNTVVKGDDEFTLSYALSRSDVEKWHTIRVTTNTAGASLSFYIYDIDVIRL